MPDPKDSFIVKKTLKGVKNIKGKPVDCRVPIIGDILAKLVSIPSASYRQLFSAFYAF